MPDTIFQTSSYLMAYRRCFGRGKRFHRVQVPGAAAYLMSRGRSAHRLEWWGAGIHDVGGAAYADTTAASALWQRIEKLAKHHHAAQLAQIPAASELISLADQSGWQVQDAEPCPVLELPADFDTYVRSLGKNMREQIKRYPKRLEKQFAVEYELAQTPEQVHRALNDLFRLHGKRWRARGQTGVLATPRRQSFHRHLCSALLKRNRLRLWSLRCDGEAACVLLSYFYGGRYSFFIGGFEPDMMRWSVGTCLFARVFAAAIEEGATEFDFLRGEEEYKYRYGAVNRNYKTVTWFDESSRGRLLKRRIALEEDLMHRIHQKFSAANRSSS